MEETGNKLIGRYRKCWRKGKDDLDQMGIQAETAEVEENEKN